jgi:hypothetical protein
MREVFGWLRIQKLRDLPYVMQYSKPVFAIDVRRQKFRGGGGA